ncbi:MAG: two-component sensor histidine kinase [Anaerolineaceae bacterium]|nr:two-component sensor histidine kinase [Anaerolineaceae bacterium]
MDSNSKSTLLPENLPPKDGQVQGKLNIFLGYAAGVGKTYAMLEAALLRQAEGVDVVVGFVETHGRSETDALLANLEIIPRRPITVRDSVRFEMDTDAVLARQPQVVLVDDLAHTNAPGLRHAHRYQDIQELLSAGIDVYATVNVQHLESLKDVVARITDYTEHETIPDSVLDESDEIELIDLPISELLDRLEAGKVYLPEPKGRTMQKFFRRGNLTALREIALRRAADRIDAQMRAYMQRHAIAGPWPAGERLLVGISSSPLSERLVRTTRRLAVRLNAEWIAAYVETPGYMKLPQADRDRVTQTLQLAESLGAQTVRLNGRSVAETLVNYALNRNVTRIVAGKPLLPRWRELLQGGSLIDQIVRLSQDLDVYIISGTSTGRPLAAGTKTRASGIDWRPFWWSIGLVVAATLIGLPLRPFINPTNLVMPYLVAVILAAVWLSRAPAILASLLSVIAFDIIFVPPYYAFAVDDAEYLLTFAGLLTVGLVISTLTARAREQEMAARRRERQTAALYELSQKLAVVTDLSAIAQTAVNHMQETLGNPAALFLPDEAADGLILHAKTVEFQLEKDSLAVARWVFRHRQVAGHHTDTLSSVDGTYLPLISSGQGVGVLAVEFTQSETPLTGEQNRLLLSYASQVALALERARLAEQARQAHLLSETEKLQTALLNAISHDLRTPLAAITGVLSSLHDDDALLSQEARHEMVSTAWEEARRLNRLVGNLLDMTRLESGALKVVCQPSDVEDLVGATLAQMPNRVTGRILQIEIPTGLPLIDIDFTLMVQVLVNLLDNAMKYAPPEEPITIQASQEGDEVILAVKDRGPGLPEAELEHVFDRFFRVNAEGISGTGLGLSIAKGIVEAHNGRIWAENRQEGGAAFSLALPVTRTD